MDQKVRDVRASDQVFLATRRGNAVAQHGPSLLVANWQTDGFFQVIDSSGRLARNVGKKGQGPEEFGFVRDLVVSGDGTVWVWDSGNQRLAQLDSELRTIGTYALPFRAQNMQGWAMKPMQRSVLLLGCWGGPTNCGAHSWSPDGLDWSFPVPDHDLGGGRYVAAAEAPDRTIWIIDAHSYRIWHLDASGRVLREGRVRQPWLDDWVESFPPKGGSGVDEMEVTGRLAIWSPRARVQDISPHEDRLVVLGITGDPSWTEVESEGFYDVGRYFDAVLNVVDVGGFDLVESIQFDVPRGMPTKFLSGSEILVAESGPVYDGLSVWTFLDLIGRPDANGR